MKGDFGCTDHAGYAGGHHEHPDKGHKARRMADHQRGAAHPMKHSDGFMRAQLNPDHGPHIGAGKNI